MKICVISNLFPPYVRGGAEQVAKSVADGLSADGYEVVVISTKPGNGLTREKKGRLTIYRFRPMNLFYYLDDFRCSARRRFFYRFFDALNVHSAFIVWRILLNERPHTVVTHNLVGIGLLIPLVIRALKIKHCHVLHDVQLAIPSGLIMAEKEKQSLIQKLLFGIYPLICKMLFQSPRVVISPSRWLMDYYISKGFFKKSKQIIMPNPLKRAISDAPIKTRKSSRFLFVGQISKHKGIDWLIDVWQKNKIDDELIIVGETERKAIAKNVLFVGKKEDEDLNTIFVQVDFLIVPSICYENSPTVISLSYANATPVIVSDAGGTKELVEEGSTGFVFRTKDEIDFIKIFKAVKNLSIDDLWLMSQNCLNKAGVFTLKNYIEIITKLFRNEI